MGMDPHNKVPHIGVPRLSSPLDGVTILDTSVQFCWSSTEDGFGYELQYARRDDFAEPRGVVLQNLPTSTRHAWLPEEPLDAGRWFWRVRTMTNDGIFGVWSPVRSFTAVTSLRRATREISLSPERPLFIFHFVSPDEIVQYWQSVPDNLRPYVVLRAERHTTEETLEVCALCQRHGVPILVQLAGPHDSYSGNYARIPLADVEYMYQAFPVVKGVQIVEQSCQGGLRQPRVRDYLTGMMRLSAAYGKIMVWADAQWHGNNIWIDAELNADFYRTLADCGEAVVPVWKMNCGWMPYAVQGPIIGTWVGGAVANWGVEPESWFWYEAGFGELGEQHGFKEGAVDRCPMPFWGQMALMGLSAGATVYSFEPQASIWQDSGEIAETARRVIFPLLSRILDWRLIPSREEVQQRIRIAYVASSADVPWREDGRPLRTVYEGTYGCEHPFQMIPPTGRYGWIPVLSPFADPGALEGLASTIHGGSFRTPEEVRGFFDGEYEPGAAGGCWTARLGGLNLVANPHENRDVAEAFSLPLDGPFLALEGRVGVNGYLVCLQDERGALKIHLNGRGERQTSLKLYLRHETAVRVMVTPEPAASRCGGSPGGRELAWEIDFSRGAVELTVACGT